MGDRERRRRRREREREREGGAESDRLRVEGSLKILPSSSNTMNTEREKEIHKDKK